MYSIYSIALAMLLLPIAFTDDQHCMNKATKMIEVSVTGDNPHKLLTYVRDDPGYARNLECKWELKASDYNKPRQMLLTVRATDFDTNDATSSQCASSAVDMFNFTFSGVSNNNQVKSERWCSDSDVPNSKAARMILANLWSSANYLTVEFKSDDKQTRSNAKGVEMDVVIMAEDYCLSSMLFHSGSCYLITAEPLNFAEAYMTSKSLLGNLATFGSNSSLQEFIASNVKRADVYDYKIPLNLNQKLWTGHYCSASDHTLSKYKNHSIGCKETESKLSLNPSVSLGPEQCRIAIQVRPDGTVSLTREPESVRLPALIQFAQIPPNIGDKHPGKFATCELPDCVTPTTAPPLWIWFVMVRAFVILIAIVVVVLVIYCRIKTRRTTCSADANCKCFLKGRCSCSTEGRCVCSSKGRCACYAEAVPLRT